MRGILRAIIVATAAACGAVAIFLALTLPPRSVRLDAGSPPPGLVFGAYHVHTNRSDGTGSVDAIADAAARAGLQFVILTDHGDATRTPDAPAYRHGVLILDGVEISVEQGHLVALGLKAAAPYPLGGDAAAVIEDVHRLGGMAIVAHPDSQNPDLRWRGGFGNADGVEWMNVDSEWRDESSSRLLATAARSLLRQPEAIASLFSRPDRTLQRWEASLPARRVFSIAAVDAHARIGWQETQEPRSRTALAWPSYESVFRTVSQGVELDGPLTIDAPADASRLLSALAAGRSFSLVRAFGAPAHLEFTATDGNSTTAAGDEVGSAGPVTLHARVPEAPGTRIAILRDGREVAHGNGSVSLGADSGVYRVEVGWPGASAPWMVSNAIAVGPRTRPAANEDDADPSPVVALEIDSPWTIERDAASTGEVTSDAGGLAFAFRLGTGAPAGQYAALTTSVKTLVGADRVTFTARAARPMRVSVQLRLPGGKDGERWRQSVYVDEQPRQITVRLRDLAPVGITTTRRPFVAPIQGLLFVVDTVNTKPGTAGTVWISSIGIGAR